MESKKQKSTAREIKKIREIVITIRNDPKAMEQAQKLIISCP